MQKPGPKPKIDLAIERQIYAILATGGSIVDAADYLGIDRRTVQRHRRKNARFAAGVDRAISKGKLRLVKKINKASPWQAAAWMLERKWGREYGKKVDVTSDGKAINLLPIKLDGDKDL